MGKDLESLTKMPATKKKAAVLAALGAVGKKTQILMASVGSAFQLPNGGLLVENTSKKIKAAYIYHAPSKRKFAVKTLADVQKIGAYVGTGGIKNISRMDLTNKDFQGYVAILHNAKFPKEELADGASPEAALEAGYREIKKGGLRGNVSENDVRVYKIIGSIKKAETYDEYVLNQKDKGAPVQPEFIWRKDFVELGYNEYRDTMQEHGRTPKTEQQYEEDLPYIPKSQDDGDEPSTPPKPVSKPAPKVSAAFKRELRAATEDVKRIIAAERKRRGAPKNSSGRTKSR